MDNRTGICNADNLAFSKELETKFYEILEEYVTDDTTHHDISVMCSAVIRVCSSFLHGNGIPLDMAVKLIGFCYKTYQSVELETREQNDK